MDGIQLNAVQFLIMAVIALVSGGGGAAIIQWRAQSPKVKAEAAKYNAEANSIRVDDQTQIIEDLDRQVKRLGVRLDETEHRLEAVETRNTSLRSALLALSHWVQRVLSILTPEQRAQVGQPPDTDHLLNP